LPEQPGSIIQSVIAENTRSGCGCLYTMDFFDAHGCAGKKHLKTNSLTQLL